MADKKIKVKEHERGVPAERVSKPQSDRPGATIIGGGAIKGVTVHSVHDQGEFPDVEVQAATREHFAKVKKGMEEQ
jgi:hypothetical protein